MKLVLDAHNHTLASGHAYSTILEYIAEAKVCGLELIAITDHAPALPGSSKSIYFENLFTLPKEIDGVKLMTGVELNILDKDGTVDMEESILNRLCPVIASLHTLCYSFSKDNMTVEEKSSEITDVIEKVMDNDYVHIIGHPGDPRYPLDIGRVVRKSLETGTLLEVNAVSLDDTGFRRGSRMIIFEILKQCKQFGCPIVIGSDSHFSKSTGKFTDVIKLLNEADFPKHLVANTSVEYFYKLLKLEEEVNI